MVVQSSIIGSPASAMSVKVRSGSANCGSSAANREFVDRAVDHRDNVLRAGIESDMAVSAWREPSRMIESAAEQRFVDVGFVGACALGFESPAHLTQFVGDFRNRQCQFGQLLQQTRISSEITATGLPIGHRGREC
jgi:hypothetical protein